MQALFVPLAHLQAYPHTHMNEQWSFLIPNSGNFSFAPVVNNLLLQDTSLPYELRECYHLHVSCATVLEKNNIKLWPYWWRKVFSSLHSVVTHISFPPKLCHGSRLHQHVPSTEMLGRSKELSAERPQYSKEIKFSFPTHSFQNCMNHV